MPILPSAHRARRRMRSNGRFDEVSHLHEVIESLIERLIDVQKLPACVLLVLPGLPGRRFHAASLRFRAMPEPAWSFPGFRRVAPHPGSVGFPRPGCPLLADVAPTPPGLSVLLVLAPPFAEGQEEQRLQRSIRSVRCRRFQSRRRSVKGIQALFSFFLYFCL